MFCRLLTVSLLLTISVGARANDVDTGWKPEATWRQSASPNSVTALIKQAESFEEDGDYSKALKYYGKIADKSINLANKAKAIYAQGRCLQKLSKPWLAFKKFRTAVDNYSSFVPYIDILNREFEIAKDNFDGGQDKFLIFAFSTDTKAIEIYDHIATVGPYAPFTPEAIYRSALLSYDLKEYDDAASKFRQIMTKYPASEFAKDARLDLAVTLLRNSVDANGDGTLVGEAHQLISLFVKRYPDHERIDEANELYQSIRSTKAKRLLYLGEFYRREPHKRNDASKRYLTELMAKYDNTESAQRAAELLAIITAEESIEEAPKVQPENTTDAEQ